MVLIEYFEVGNQKITKIICFSLVRFTINPSSASSRKYSPEILGRQKHVLSEHVCVNLLIRSCDRLSVNARIAAVSPAVSPIYRRPQLPSA